MSLPTLSSPTYKLKLLSRNDVVKYRPYTVKEEKAILMALEDSDTSKDLFEVIINLCQTCILDDIDIKTIPIFDLERLVIAIRSKSVGEQIKTSVICEKCENSIEYVTNTDNLKTTEDKDIENKIMLNDSCGVILRFPELRNMDRNVKTADE